MEVSVISNDVDVKTVSYRFVSVWLQPGDKFPSVNFVRKTKGQHRNRTYNATASSYRRLAGLVWDLAQDGHRLSVNQLELGWTLFLREVR